VAQIHDIRILLASFALYIHATSIYVREVIKLGLIRKSCFIYLYFFNYSNIF